MILLIPILVPLHQKLITSQKSINQKKKIVFIPFDNSFQKRITINIYFLSTSIQTFFHLSNISFVHSPFINYSSCYFISLYKHSHHKLTSPFQNQLTFTLFLSTTFIPSFVYTFITLISLSLLVQINSFQLH